MGKVSLLVKAIYPQALSILRVGAIGLASCLEDKSLSSFPLGFLRPERMRLGKPGGLIIEFTKPTYPIFICEKSTLQFLNFKEKKC